MHEEEADSLNSQATATASFLCPYPLDNPKRTTPLHLVQHLRPL